MKTANTVSIYLGSIPVESPPQPMAVTMFEWCGCPKEGCMGVGVGSMCPAWLNGGRWPMDMCPAREAELKGEVLSCKLLGNSS